MSKKSDTKKVNKLFQLFDTLTEKIPYGILLYIRMVAIFIWVIAAGIAIYYSWETGVSSAPPSGQDTYLSEIKEKETIEENLKNPPSLSVPSLSDLKPKEGKADLPEFQDVVPEKKEDTLPPYITEKETPDDTGAFLPRSSEDPGRRRKDPSSGSVEDTGSVKGGLLPP